MKPRAMIGWTVIAAAGILALAGCDDTVSSKQAKAHPPAATPAPIPEFVREPLPFPEHTVFLTSLYDTRPSIDILIDQVQVIFNTAQKEYKSGEFDKAHANYDHAVDLILRAVSRWIPIRGFPTCLTRSARRYIPTNAARSKRRPRMKRALARPRRLMTSRI